MARPALTVGAIEEIYSGNKIQKPIVQVLGTKRLGVSNRYRLLISDSITISSFTMLITSLNHLIEDGDLDDFTIIEITRYSMVRGSNVEGTRPIMVLLEIAIKMPGEQVGGLIGHPMPFRDYKAANGTEIGDDDVSDDEST